MGVFDDVVDAGRQANLDAQRTAEDEKALVSRIGEELYRAIVRYVPDFVDAAKKSNLPTTREVCGVNILGMAGITATSAKPGWWVQLVSPGGSNCKFWKIEVFIRTSGQIYGRPNFWPATKLLVWKQEGVTGRVYEHNFSCALRDGHLSAGPPITVRKNSDDRWQTIDEYVQSSFRDRLAPLR